MRAHLSNAAFGILDYAVYPVGMLAAAPTLLHHLGTAQYGLWVVATAAVNAGAILASGFGDSLTQRVAALRQRAQEQTRARNDLLTLVRGAMTIHLALSLALAIGLWVAIPLLLNAIVHGSPNLHRSCLLSLRIASVVIPVRALESVCVAVQRAFARYGAAIGLSVCGRLLALIAAVLLTRLGFGVIAIMAAGALLALVSTGLQIRALQRYLHAASLLPVWNRAAIASIAGLGIYTWIQAASGVISGQADRLALGVSLGAGAVASYALCVQMAQPIYGLAASGLHFLFPHIAERGMANSSPVLAKTVAIAFAANLLLVAAGSAVVLIFGPHALLLWTGASIAGASAPILPWAVCGSACLGLSVTGTYTLLALGRGRLVSFLSVAGGAGMLLLMTLLLPRFGVIGLAGSRVFPGLLSLFVYLPLARQVRASLPGRLELLAAEDA